MSAYIQAIATHSPKFVTKQSQIADFMVKHLRLDAEEEKKLRVLYRASGIQKRHSVLEDFGKNLNGQSFFKENTLFPSAKPRMNLYQKHALGLAKKAAEKVLAETAKSAKEITHLITVSCTGMYAPGLDIELVEQLQLKTSIERTSINFMGCYAAFNALKLANQILAGDSQAQVLIVSVELCTIHLQKKKDDENLLANAIFSDGVAALLIGSKPSERSLELEGFFSDLVLSGKKEMGWYIGDYGFEMKLSLQIPKVIKEGIEVLTNRLLEKIALTKEDIALFAIHPGGKRILEVIEEKLHISKEENWAARYVLRNYGNMSSPTILFVIKKLLDSLQPKDDQKNILSFAFGPGLTLESAVLKTHISA